MRLVVSALAAVLMTSAVSAEPSMTLAATDAASPVAEASSAPAGHQSSDPALAVAAVEETPEEMVKAAPLERPEPTLFADIDLTNQRMTVRDAEGNTYGPWKISSARGGYVTPTGTYSVNYTARMHYSK